MEDTTLDVLLVTAASIGFLHTLMGPDHYLPFIALSRAGNWTLRKTMLVTTACGIGHVASSVVLGFAGLAVGVAVAGLVNVEEFRGNVAGYLLLGFGLAYMVWGLRRVWRNRPHTHLHAHAASALGYHAHPHNDTDAQLEVPDEKGRVVTPWLVFLIFVFGPCEPLIPVLMFPAAKASVAGSVLVATVFGVATLGTMFAMVALGYFGLARLNAGHIERYAHAACGGAIAACGAMVVFGL